MNSKEEEIKNVTSAYSTTKETEIIIDLIGPILDISKISDFYDIPNVRYLHEREIVGILNRRHLGGGISWTDKAIFERIIDVLATKSRISILDKSIVELLIKAKRYGASVKIISGVPNDVLFKASRNAIIDYSEIICKKLNKTKEEMNVSSDDFKPLSKESFEPLGKGKNYKNLQKFIESRTSAYRIVFDDEIDAKIYINPAKSQLVQEWISGISDKDCFSKFKDIIEKRERIAMADFDIKALVANGRGKILLEKYAVHNNFQFYVFDCIDLENIRENIKMVQAIIKNESDEQQDKPICIFLAGAPGSGKSYFVKLLAKYLKADDRYPVASLSGVPESGFADAVRKHIDTVYDQRTNKSNFIHIAFLDEVDTKVSGLAFRLLMDAMTGDATDERGVRIKKRTKNLVWLFAGSAGANREDFIVRFHKEDLKVMDFFDRIHFDIILPNIQKPGQAILTFFSSLDRPKEIVEIKVSRSVLLLFGRTVWKSTRQIKTICRIACAENKFNWENIYLECFNKVGISTEFTNSYRIVKTMENKNPTLKRKISIIFPSNSTHSIKRRRII